MTDEGVNEGVAENDNPGVAEGVGLLEGLLTTRAIRRYTDEPIPDADLATIMFAATRAPSGSNRQNFRFVVLRDGPVATEAKSLLGAAFRSGWEQKVSADGWSDTDHDPTSRKARTLQTMQHYVDNFERTPVVVVPCIRRRHDALLDGASIYPACQNLLLAARALGWGGVLTGWHGTVEPQLRTLLKIPAEWSVAATITLGRPAGGHGPVRRRPLDQLVFDDVWDGEATWAAEPPGTRHTGGPPNEER